jgi:hypothetical protein
MSDTLTRNWQDDSRRRKKRRPGFTVQEALGADAISGEQTRGSGCSTRPSRKGDAESVLFRLSGKTTGKAAVTIKREWWDEIRAQAQATGVVPVLMVGWDATATKPRCDLLCFDRETAKHMQKALTALLSGNVGEARAHAGLAVGRSNMRDA